MIIQAILAAYPETHATYLFGSHATDSAWPDSDVDLALLLPHAQAKQVDSLALSDLRFAVETHLERPVDLVNLRRVSTVFQKEIVMTPHFLRGCVCGGCV